MRLFSNTAAIRSAASNRTVAATMCALVVAMSTASAVHAADERPDLKLEVFSLPSPRDVQVRVTNISAWWATGSQLNVETVSPVAGNLKRLDIGNLDPGESFNLTYTLAAECNGDLVKASVTPAKNYAGVAETELNNNQLQSQVCPSQEPTKPAARTSGAVGLRPSSSVAAVSPKPVDVTGAVVGQGVEPGAAVPGVGLPSQRSTTTTGEVDQGPRIAPATNATRPDGSNGISGYEVVSGESPPSGGPATAQCPDGKKVLGGGAGSTRPMEFSFPTNNNTAWIVGIINNPPGGSVVAYAICANVT